MVRWLSLRRALVLGTFAVALGMGAHKLDAQERQWIFQASSSIGSDPSNPGGMDSVWIGYRSAESDGDVKLHGLWDPNPDPSAPILLYLHGARRNVDGSAFRIRHMRELGFSVLAIDYRGFGQSTDELPSEARVDEDARAAWDWIAKNHPGRDRYIFGHSLGGAIAVNLASQVPDAKGLIVEGTFPSIADVFRSFKFGWLPITGLITQRFEAGSSIVKVKAPILVVHGDSDRLIPPSLGRALYERATAPKRFVLVEGGNHYSTNSVGQAQYKQALHDLFGWPK
jgi:alpha-beta hydrolase superfamily lysophospholipase